MNKDELWTLGITSIKGLESEQGILASSRTEVYGCIFGRDSLITSLSLLRVYQQTGDAYFLALVKKVLLNLATLQGMAANIESGEEPGKCIHEYRTEGHEHLTKLAAEPWFVYADGVMRNYDTVDATPLLLMAIYEYLTLAPYEGADTERLVAAARAALSWLETYGDSNGDGFIDYRFPPERAHGGLRVQSWMDSSESLFFETSEERPAYPIAPVEVQAYAYVALRNWGRYFVEREPKYAAALHARAQVLKKVFNERFVFKRGRSVSLAYAIDGRGRRLVSARSSMASPLWAVSRATGAPESILYEEYIPGVAARLLAPDLFVPSAGIRTLSTRSPRFSPVSYHNGSIWPHDTAMCAEGLENFGYHEQALRVRRSLVRSYTHFKAPIELFGYARGFQEYREPSGKGACQTQAWSAASMLTASLALPVR